MNKPAKYHFFVDAKKYETDQASISGAEIKAMVGLNPAYHLFMEGTGNEPDRPVADSDGFSLEPAGGVKHFYSAPPATFGVK